MTRVDFYILARERIQERLEFACRLTEQLFRSGRQVYLHTPDESLARTLDELLWSHNPSSFIPHSLATNPVQEKVAIGWGAQPGDHSDVLVNLDLEVPGFFSRFDRVSEIVVQEVNCRDALRNSYKFYKERGYRLEKHDIG